MKGKINLIVGLLIFTYIGLVPIKVFASDEAYTTIKVEDESDLTGINEITVVYEDAGETEDFICTLDSNNGWKSNIILNKSKYKILDIRTVPEGNTYAVGPSEFSPSDGDILIKIVSDGAVIDEGYKQKADDLEERLSKEAEKNEKELKNPESDIEKTLKSGPMIAAYCCIVIFTTALIVLTAKQRRK